MITRHQDIIIIIKRQLWSNPQLVSISKKIRVARDAQAACSTWGSSRRVSSSSRDWCEVTLAGVANGLLVPGLLKGPLAKLCRDGESGCEGPC